jgi:hypothetical protein
MTSSENDRCTDGVLAGGAEKEGSISTVSETRSGAAAIDTRYLTNIQLVERLLTLRNFTYDPLDGTRSLG